MRVKRQPQTIIERVTEQPRKPAPKVIERCENEPCPPPLVRNTCVMVEPSQKCGCNAPPPQPSCGCQAPPPPPQPSCGC